MERIVGAHCYEFYAGASTFAALQDEDPGTFYLTDFLARQFDTMIIRGLGLDEHPELLPMYFGNYHRLIYLAQTDDPALLRIARRGGEETRSHLRVQEDGVRRADNRDPCRYREQGLRAKAPG